MTDHQITIGPEFFSKAKNDYNDWAWALVREFNQNCVDCGSKSVRWTVSYDGQSTVVFVQNDGKSMTREILVEKLLSLGSSGKDFSNGSVGGFGKAKEILYFCWRSYQIRTGPYLVTGSGGTYQLDENLEHFEGTTSTIVIDGDVRDKLRAAFESFCSFSQCQAKFYWNGYLPQQSMRKGTLRKHIGLGKVYTNKTTTDTLVVRMHGIPMFYERINFNRCVVLELEGKSSDVLTSNRDGLTYQNRGTLSAFVTELAVDCKSALKSDRITYLHYKGQKIRHQSGETVSGILGIPAQAGDSLVAGIGTTTQITTDGGEIDGYDLLGDTESSPGTKYDEAGVIRNGKVASYPVEDGTQHNTEIKSAVGEEFVIKNETNLQVPDYYRLDGYTEFSSYAKKLVRVWGRLMLQLHKTFDFDSEFAIGFIFSDDGTEAQHERGSYGTVYYIAPARAVRQHRSRSKSWKKRFKLTERNRLLAIAAHEFVHGLGYAPHDEAYANKLTDVMFKIMDCRKDFNWCWK